MCWHQCGRLLDSTVKNGQWLRYLCQARWKVRYVNNFGSINVSFCVLCVTGFQIKVVETLRKNNKEFHETHFDSFLCFVDTLGRRGFS